MKIKITEGELREIVNDSIKRVLNEERIITQYEVDSHVVSVKDYDLSNKYDKAFFSANKSVIWDILAKGYENHGGFKGYQYKSDLTKKTGLAKLGFIDGDIVTVTVYNNSNRNFIGNKLVGATCVKDDRHKTALALLKLILKDNIEHVDQWIWVEASGKIEDMCRELGAFNVPSDYLDLYLQNVNYDVVDQYHYRRVIGGVVMTKTIFGFNSIDVYNELLSEIKTDFHLVDDKIGMINDNYVITESMPKRTKVYRGFMSKQPVINTYRDIIGSFYTLKYEEGYNELLPEYTKKLSDAINAFRKEAHEGLKGNMDNKVIQSYIDEGEKILNTSSIFMPIELNIKEIV